jgi:hypothetical protein
MGVLIGMSKTLKKSITGPIRLVVVGGFIAVTYLQNRDVTGDINFILDPTVPHYSKVSKKLALAIATVADVARYSPQWANDHVGPLDDGLPRVRLFAASMNQDELIYKGYHIRIYAAR